MLENFVAATFAPLIGTPFAVRLDDASTFPLRLSEASEASGEGARAAAALGRRVPFSLLFHGPVAPVLAQRTHRVEHERLGAFDLFLVPIGPDADGMRYEAVFG